MIRETLVLLSVPVIYAAIAFGFCVLIADWLK